MQILQAISIFRRSRASTRGLEITGTSLCLRLPLGVLFPSTRTVTRAIGVLTVVIPFVSRVWRFCPIICGIIVLYVIDNVQEMVLRIYIYIETFTECCFDRLRPQASRCRLGVDHRTMRVKPPSNSPQRFVDHHSCAAYMLFAAC